MPPVRSRFCACAIPRPSECEAIAPESRPIDKDHTHGRKKMAPDGASHREEEAAKERCRCAAAAKSGDPQRGTQWSAFSGAPLRGNPRPGYDSGDPGHAPSLAIRATRRDTLRLALFLCRT